MWPLVVDMANFYQDIRRIRLASAPLVGRARDAAMQRLHRHQSRRVIADSARIIFPIPAGS